MKKSSSGNYTIYESTDPCELHKYSETLAKELEKKDNEIEKSLKESADNINELEEDNILNQENITEIIDLLPKVSNEGESIALENTARAKFTKFRIGGNSSQETRSGYNLLNVPEVLEISIFKEIKINLKANNTYTFKFDNAIAGSDNNISLITFRNTADIVTKSLNTSTVKKFEIQPTQDITNIRIYASTDYSSSTGKTKTFQKLMIYEGTEDTEYEQYGTMPSVEFPSEIRNVGDNINVFNKTAEDFKNGISYGWAKKLTLKLEPNTLYTCSSNDETPIGGNTNLLFGGSITDSYFVNKYVSRTCLTNGDGDIDIYLRATTIDDFFEKYYIKVEKGTRATTSSEYGCGNLEVIISNENLGNNESHIVFPFVQGQKLMQGDYLADDGIHHTRKQIELDGTEKWNILESQKRDTTSYFYFAKADMKKASKIMCNKFTNASLWAKDVEGIESIVDNNVRLRINTSRASTVAELEALLAAQKEKGTPVVIEYELAEEEVEEYTEAQKEARKQIKNARSYEGQTNIFSTNEIKPIFEVEALADIGLLLNNMQAQILAGGE